MISDEGADSVRRQLTQRLAQLRGDLARDRNGLDELRQRRSGHEVIDPAELAGDTALAEVQQPAAEILAREALHLEAALRRLAEGDYGLCADCHRRIPAARLMAEPACLRCLTCQEAHEATVQP